MFVHHGGAMKMTFHDQLVTTRDRKHSKDHLFFQLWAQGKLTKKQTAIYCAQHYHYVTEYLNWMAYEASQIPIRDVKAYLFENLGDEENPEDRHLDMLKDYVQATGSSRESVQDSVALAATEGLQNWGWRLVYQTPWQAALAGMFIGLESQFLDICKKIVPALHENYGFAAGGPQVPLFGGHVGADGTPRARGYEVVWKNCETPDLQASALHAGAAATIRRWRYMNGIYWFSVHGKEDDNPIL